MTTGSPSLWGSPPASRLTSLTWPLLRPRSGTALALGSATVFLAVLLVAATKTLPPGFDLAVHPVLHGQHGTVATAITTAGSSLVLYPLTAVLAATISASRRWWRVADALIALAVLAVGSALRAGAMVVIARARPARTDWLEQASGFAFPSGHTANTTMAVGVLALMYASTGPARSRRLLAGLLAGGFAAGVGWSRVYLGMHWPTDVVGGWAFGLLWLSLVALVASRVRAGSGTQLAPAKPPRVTAP